MTQIHLASFMVAVVRHERFRTIVVFDDEEYEIAHSDVRLKDRLLEIPIGTMLESSLFVDLDWETKS
jgi:hypothetical protein